MPLIAQYGIFAVIIAALLVQEHVTYRRYRKLEQRCAKLAQWMEKNATRDHGLVARVRGLLARHTVWDYDWETLEP